MGSEDWLRQRARAVHAHAAAEERRVAAEVAQARQLVAGFVAAARERGLRTTALIARSYTGRGRYRTGLHGWYLRPQGAIAVGTDGDFYVLLVPASPLARLTGVRLRPEQPRLVVGEGARDGERISLRALLEQRLAAGDRWPP
ncbi:MAG: hypothetical protein AUI14_17295 [Actinobacteria bacterium 13_2_20CM_2_71_6]|nr:MAG: hypothetical protein AUI14_17295 [Actinobacteria bacterium 13_2_20CM_2_71_6]